MHKPMEPAKLAYHIMTRSKVQVICVTQYDLHTKAAKLFGRQGFDCGLGTYWDQDRCLNATMGGVYLSKPGMAF